MSISRLALVLATLAFLLASDSAAQLDLPRAPDKPAKAGDAKPTKQPKAKGGGQRGNLAPHLVCTVCYERNYTASLDSVGKDGLANVFCQICRRATFHKRSGTQKAGGDLDLPSPSVEVADQKPTPLAGTVAGPLGAATDDAAAFIFAEVRKARALDDSLALRAVDSLVALGEPGFVEARKALADDEPTVCLCAARVLLRSPEAADRDRVVQRLRGRMPRGVGQKVLTEVVQADPVHGTPELLVELLDHSNTKLRNAAFRELHGVMNPELRDSVREALKSKRALTRARAVDLLGRLEDASVIEDLLPCLGDPSARVASSAATLLALSSEESVVPRLLAIAFDRRWILRESSYALLAIIEREDANLSAILTEVHSQALLQGLESNDPFISGVCATALAGIGFRSPDVLGSAWLERSVPDRMVSAVSGKVFHADFASLQPHALRRLRLLTGETSHSDGQAWVKWWVAERNQFYPHRAHLFVDPERVGTLAVHYRDLRGSIEVFNLIGADLAASAHRNPPRAGEQIFLTKSEARDLISLLRSEGVLGAERLPGSLGERGAGERSLEVMIDGHGKRFLVGEGRSQPWFERVSGALRAVRERGRWQRYPDPRKYDNSYELWLAESEWWSENHTPAERGLRSKTQLMAWIESTRVASREASILELKAVSEVPGVRQPTDFAFLRDRLKEENFLGPRSEVLLELALEAARLIGKDGLVSQELATELTTVLSDTFGTRAAPEVARVIQAAGSDYARQVSLEGAPVLRAISARVLSRSGKAEDRERLLAMLEDESEDVQIAAMLALGEQKIEEGRTDLLVRARFSERNVRIAALRAVSFLGGEYVFDALVAGRSDTDPLVRAAAVQGLAQLGDARAAPLLISLLAKGQDSATFDLARDGLKRMGAEAHTDLLQAMYSPTNHARRQATFLLGEQLQAQATSTMISMLTDAPGDRILQRELAILTCVDFSSASDASIRWWDWWDEVVHDDSLAWFRGALEREDRTPPAPENFRAGGTLEGALFLVSVLASPKPHLAERARRELALMLDRELPRIPADSEERTAWIASLKEAVLAQWET